MPFDLVFFAFTVPPVLFAGISKGGFGSGAAFAATPFLALILPPQVAVGLMLPLLMLMDVTSLRAYWRQWDWCNARAMMIAAVPGVGLGLALFEYADPELLRVMIGVIALGFVAFQIARGRGWLRIRPAGFRVLPAALSGLTAGFTSYVSHAGGPPAAMHLLGQNLDKRTYQATTVLLFWWINLLKLPPFIATGVITADTFRVSLMLAPAAFVGTLIGVWAHSRIPERPFFAVIYVFLTLTGLKLVLGGLS